MPSLPSFDTENEPKIARSVEKFFKDYKVMELLRRCGLRKSKGIPLWSILSHIFSNVFPDRSMYMQQKSGKCTAGFSKNTYYQLMQNPHINWLRLTILLAERIVNGHLKDLTSDQRPNRFITLVLKERSECHRDDQEDRQAHNRGQEADYGPIKGDLCSYPAARSSLESRAHCQVRHVWHLVLQSLSDCPNQSTWFERNRHGKEKLQDYIRVRRKADERQTDLQRMQEASGSFKISPVRPCKGWRSCQR